MYAQLLALLLFVCQIVLNGSTDTTAACETVTITITEPPPIVAIPLDYTIFSEDNAAYKIYKKLATWDEARERCESDYGHLAIADTVNKITHIKSLKSNDQGSHWMHVGIYYSKTTNGWVRVDNGSPVTSLPWSSLEDNPAEGCAGVSISEDKLVSYPCDRPGEYFVCGISLSLQG